MKATVKELQEHLENILQWAQARDGSPEADDDALRKIADIAGTALAEPDDNLHSEADDCDEHGLYLAHLNYLQWQPKGFCECEDRTGMAQVYFRDKDSGVHGWMCSECRHATQIG